MSEVKLMVLYPQPTDMAKFDSDYCDHLRFFHQKSGIPENEHPYTITRFLSGKEGPSPFYQLFTLPFPSANALEQAMSSPEMKAVAADAIRISSGGAPVVLIGSEE